MTCVGICVGFKKGQQEGAGGGNFVLTLHTMLDRSGGLLVCNIISFIKVCEKIDFYI